MRAPVARGDSVVVSTVAGTGHKDYPLAVIPQNYYYNTVSDQPEVEPGQELAWPLSFHGGIGYSKYDPQTGGALYGTGLLCDEPNVIRAGVAATAVTLTGAANPPQYFFETDVNDAGADDGRPRLYVIAPEAAEINVYKISLAYGYTATGTGVTTDATAKTLTDARASWTVNEWVGEIVTCNSQTLTVTSNAATVLTGTGGWSADPGDAHAYKIGVGDFGTLLDTQTFALTPTQPMGRPAEWYDGTNTQWRLPTGDTTNDIQSLTSIVSAAATDTWEPTDSGACDADARHLKVVGQKLYRTTGKNEVSILARNTSPSTESNWGDEFYVGSDATKITDIGEAGGLCYISKADGVYEWDGEGEADNIFPAIGNAERNGQGLTWWHGGFMVPAGSALWWTRTGKPVGPDSNPNNRGNHPSYGSSANYFKHGRWMGLAPFGEYIYALYADSSGTAAHVCQGRERDASDPPGWGPIIWQTIDLISADFDDFHGIFITETSEFSTTETRPCLWFASGNNVAHIWLDKSGAPISRRSNISLSAVSSIRSGDLDLGYPRVLKQLHRIDGWAEDMNTGHKFEFFAYLDGGSPAQAGADITEDGYFECFWTQDSSDTARSMVIEPLFTAVSNTADQNGPLLKDVMVRAIAVPDTSQEWHIFFGVEDDRGRTAKTLRAELEAYRSDLKKWELPDGDSFNGVLKSTRLLRADEIRDLTPRNQEPPRYIIEGVIREMAGA